MGGRSDRQTQNTIAEPWSGAQPFLLDLVGDTQGIYEAGNLTPSPFGPRLAGESAQTLASRQGMASTATSGNPITGAVTDAYGNMVGGGNTYGGLDAVREQALRQSLPAAASYFSNSGMLNSSVAGEGMAEAAARAIAPIEFGAHENAQSRALSAMSLAPQLAGMPYYDDQMLGRVGGMYDMRAQQELDDQAALYYETQDQPYQDIARASGLAMGYGGMGGTQSGSNTSRSNPGALGWLGALMQPAAMFARMF